MSNGSIQVSTYEEWGRRCGPPCRLQLQESLTSTSPRVWSAQKYQLHIVTWILGRSPIRAPTIHSQRCLKPEIGVINVIMSCWYKLCSGKIIYLEIFVSPEDLCADIFGENKNLIVRIPGGPRLMVAETVGVLHSWVAVDVSKKYSE